MWLGERMDSFRARNSVQALAEGWSQQQGGDGPTAGCPRWLPTVWPEQCPSNYDPEARWVVEELAMA